MTPALSIIIPVLNEENTLPIILGDIKKCKQALYFPIECIVVDGGSEDDSVRICEKFKVCVVQAARGRGHQLRVGAQKSTGQVLLFLHADSRLTAEHCLRAVQTVQNNGVVAGGFKLKFNDTHPVLKLAEWINVIRFRCSKIIYGDHGIFLLRDNYDAVGGFPAQSLFEDIEFSRRLKKHGRVLMIDPAIKTSSRRFRAGGIIRTYLKMATLHILYWLKVSPEFLAKLYEKRAARKSPT